MSSSFKELLTIAAYALRQIVTVNTTGVAGGPIVPLHGLSDDSGNQIGLTANPLVTSPSIGVASEASAAPLSLAGQVLLSTQAAGPRAGFWFFQNQSAVELLLVLDDGTEGAKSIFAMDPAAASGRQGASMGSADTGPHLGRIRVYGPAGSQHALRVQ